uniref:Uncharacterized protein n=1 Tax=viral metagenome TaxID=1070528 RepID=A0A6C0DDT9_9ZZZZ
MDTPPTPDEHDEINGIIKAIDTPSKPEESDEITGIIKAIDTPSKPEEPDEITDIIKSIDPPLPPYGSMSPSSGSTVGKTDEIINIINAIESYIKKEQPIINESEELFSIINAVETHIQLQSKIGKIIDIINKINEIENKDQDREPNQEQDQEIIKIIKGIYMGETTEISIDPNTLYEGITFISHALIAMNKEMIEYLLIQGADINAGTPTFLELLEFYAIIYKKQPSYKGPIDNETQEKMDQLQNENDLLKQHIDELTAQLAIEKDSTKIKELENTINGLNEIIKQKDDEIKAAIKAATTEAATTQTATTQTATTQTATTQTETTQTKETESKPTEIAPKKCPVDNPNIVKLGTINTNSEICYDIEKQEFV